jgi:hypothetical protein
MIARSDRMVAQIDAEARATREAALGRLDAIEDIVNIKHDPAPRLN